MLSKAEKYRQMIQKAIKRVMLFPNEDKEEKKSTVTLQCNIKLPSSYPFRQSQQIEKNMSITHHITHQSLQQYPTSLSNNLPKSCIGLVLCQHRENNQTYYVYGTGILIHNNIVLTSAQNVYCRRLNRQYTDIRFISSVSGGKCSGIYDVMRVHYPKEYIMQEYENYNFAVLQLYDDLIASCGYVGWKSFENIEEDENYTVYGYIRGNQQGFFNLRQIKNNQKKDYWEEDYLGSGVVVRKNKDKCSIVGLQQQKKIFILSEKLRNMINQWTQLTSIRLQSNKINAQGCKYLSQTNWTHLTSIYLTYNRIDVQGCKYLSQTNWNLRLINLGSNNIGAQGCKYLSQAKWAHLIKIDLGLNNIDAQGCKYLSQANWTHLIQINLVINNINGIIYRLLLQQSYPKTTIYI